MFAIKGTVHKEVPDPRYSNHNPNWHKVEVDEPLTIEGADKEDAFRKMQKWEARAWNGTTNGMVPSFTFEDKALQKEFEVWNRNHPDYENYDMW